MKMIAGRAHAGSVKKFGVSMPNTAAYCAT
jgi:hypothetical protein